MINDQLRLQTRKWRAWHHGDRAKTVETPRHLHRRTSIIFSFRKLICSRCFDGQQERQRNRNDFVASMKFHLRSATTVLKCRRQMTQVAKQRLSPAICDHIRPHSIYELVIMRLTTAM